MTIDDLYHVSNVIIASCYAAIFFMIFSGLIHDNQLGRNAIGTATAAIFFTCSLGHFAHVLGHHFFSAQDDIILQTVVDALTVIPATSYVLLRRKYGLVIRGPDMILDYQRQLAHAEAEMLAMREVGDLKDEFFSIAAHELRTPLTSIKGYIHILHRRLRDTTDARATEALTQLDAQINRLGRLIGSFLDVARLEAGRMTYNFADVDIAALVRATVKTQQLTVHHTLHLHCSALPPHIRTDADRLEQVLTNLISNAVKYSPTATRVDITLHTVGEWIELCVTDYGIGISVAALPHIFERYYRAHPADTHQYIAGMGIGLYLAYQIVCDLHGTLTVESIEGNGSTFTVRLPVFVDTGDIRSVAPAPDTVMHG